LGVANTVSGVAKAVSDVAKVASGVAKAASGVARSVWVLVGVASGVDLFRPVRDFA
jgi:hypothetical protein